MKEQVREWRSALQSCLETITSQVHLDENKMFIAGVSTSEIVGKRIGSAGSEEAAEALYQEFAKLRDETGVHLAFQCCEHLNRALVLERKTAQAFWLDEVTAIPHRKAGGAMASHAYQQFNDPVLVEHVKADAGIDIGDTMIGMHLKHVAVPLRGDVKEIGEAHVTMAKTRPKLVGGIRAHYPESK